MSTANSTTECPDATDALFSVDPSDLAVRFGDRTKQLIREGRDPYQAARLAGSFAARAIARQSTVLAFRGGQS